MSQNQQHTGNFINLGYNCLERLNDRHEFQRSCRLHHRIPANVFDAHDLFAICDAVLKRGGFLEVDKKGRWGEIADSLSHYSYSADFSRKIYLDYLREYENRLAKNEHLAQKYVFSEPTVEQFDLPRRLLTGHLENILSTNLYRAEDKLMEQLGIRFLDQYLSLRTVALTGKFLMTKIPKDYMEKYAAICKFMLAGSAISITGADPSLLEFLKIGDKSYVKKVLLMGDTFFNARLAYKLSQFNFEVTVLEMPQEGGHNTKQEGLEYWPAAIQDQFVNELKELGIDPKKLPTGGVRMFDKRCDQYNQTDVQIAGSLLQDRLQEVVKTKKSSSLNESVEEGLEQQKVKPLHRDLARMHFRRLLMTEVLLREQTETKTLERHNHIRGLAKNSIHCYYAHEGPSYSHVRALLTDKNLANRVKLVSAFPYAVEIKQNQVFLSCTQGKRCFDYFVYGLVDNVIKATYLKQFRLPEFFGEYLVNSYFGLRSVKFEQQVHREVVLQGGDSASFGGQMGETCWVQSELLGCIYLRIIEVPIIREYSCNVVFLVCYKKSFPETISKEEQLEEVMNTINKIYLRQTTYSVKQLTPIIRREALGLLLKESEQERWKNILEMRMRLYFNVPIATAKYSSLLAEYMAAGDYILNSIVCSVYPLNDFSQTVYQTHLSEETVIVRKVSKDVKQQIKLEWPLIPASRSISTPCDIPAFKSDHTEFRGKRPEIKESAQGHSVVHTRSQENIGPLSVAAQVQSKSSDISSSERRSKAKQSFEQENVSIVKQSTVVPPEPKLEPQQKQVSVHIKQIKSIEASTQTMEEVAKEKIQPMTPRQFQPVQVAADQKSPAWQFGLDHTTVRGHCEFFRSVVDTSGWTQALISEQLLQLQSPIQLDSTRTLWSLGHPYLIRSKQSFNHHVEGRSYICLSDIPDRFVSRRVGVSVFDPKRLTCYYQTVLYIEKLDIFLYVVVDQLFPATVLYHKDLGKLMSLINKKIEADASNKNEGPRIPLERLEPSEGKNFLFPTVLRQTIEKELKHLDFLDMLLEAKIAKEGDKVSRPLYYSSKCAFLCKELSDIMNQQALRKGLRQLNIFELLIGQYDPRVLLVKKVPMDWRTRTEDTHFRLLKSLEQEQDPECDRFRIDMIERDSNYFKLRRRYE